MRILPRGMTLLLIGAALTGCVANNAQTTRSSGHRSATAQLASVDKPAPDIVGIDADGQRFHLSDYRGKVILLDFWASW